MAGVGADASANRAAAAAGDLYGMPLGEFTAARAERAKQARADGDREAAAAIGKLPKPNVVAWLANQLAREDTDELRPLLELGGAMRRATADLDAGQLRQLSRQQHQVVAALACRARELAAAAGQAVSDSTARGLEDTLHAALADEQAAGQLTRGQLATGLSRTGFPGIDSAAAAWAAAPRERAPRTLPNEHGDAAPGGRKSAAGPGQRRAPAARGERSGRASAGRAAPGRPSAADRAAEAAKAAAKARRQQLERAQRAEADARDGDAEARRDQDHARDALAAAEDAARQAEETISRLQDKLDAALDARNNAGLAQRQARKEADRAERTARQAARRLTEATARREDLERDL